MKFTGYNQDNIIFNKIDNFNDRIYKPIKFTKREINILKIDRYYMQNTYINNINNNKTISDILANTFNTNPAYIKRKLNNISSKIDILEVYLD